MYIVLWQSPRVSQLLGKWGRWWPVHMSRLGLLDWEKQITTVKPRFYSHAWLTMTHLKSAVSGEIFVFYLFILLVKLTPSVWLITVFTWLPSVAQNIHDLVWRPRWSRRSTSSTLDLRRVRKWPSHQWVASRQQTDNSCIIWLQTCSENLLILQFMIFFLQSRC